MRSSAAEVHGRDLPDRVTRRVRVVEVDRPALVLGSTQPDTDVDHAAAARLDVGVVRRRSGGGAVLLDPGDTVWIDVEVGRDDDLWDDDVGRSALWLGRVWVDALDDVGVVGALAHTGPMVSSPLATVVCFAGLAPGEVTVGGRKIVGVSQRRTRAGARFQCAVPRRWDVERYARLLAPGLERVGVASEIDVATVPVDPDVVSAVLDRLAV